jgi:hypothetical protein
VRAGQGALDEAGLGMGAGVKDWAGRGWAGKGRAGQEQGNAIDWYSLMNGLIAEWQAV